jgi:phosphatidylserine/phosphatidylglycerophosphate/cardiolipin synthase-like enzyme
LNKIFYFLFIGIFVVDSFNNKPNDSSNRLTQAIPLQTSVPDAFFTDLSKVGNGLASPVIMDRLIAMLDAASQGSTVSLCIFGFDHAGVIDALKRASNRGVTLKLMIDMSREETIAQNPPTISKLRSFINSNSEVIVVKSDAGTSSINHNKFVLFSQLETKSGKVQNIVFQTSHNFTVDDKKKIQDVVILSQKGLYDAYLAYWNDMKAKAGNGMKDFYYKEYDDPATGVTACFFPKRRNGVAYGGDNIIEILDAITEPSTALIRIGMSDWVASRINVVQKLDELLAQGATIEVIAKSKADQEILDGLENLRIKGAYVKIYNLTYSNQVKINIHSKFMLIRGKWKGEQCDLLVTGSYNFTTNALRYNNEALLILKNHNDFFSTYMKVYDDMKKLPGLVK